MITKLFLTVVLLSSTCSGFSAASNKQITWPEYKHDFIDPISGSHHSGHPLEGAHLDPHTRELSDQFWLAQFWEEKEKMHQMNLEIAEASVSKDESSFTSFETYQNLLSQTISKNQNHLEGHMDPEMRARADKYWLQTFLQEKEKLHGKNKKNHSAP
jgi:hypothetical protein